MDILKKRHSTKSHSFIMIEMMISIALFSFMIMGVYAVLRVGQMSWFDADANIVLQQNLRQTLGRITQELHQSGFDKDANPQVFIGDGSGPDSTDILKFSIPIVCTSGSSIIDINGDVQYWGAPLTWGCTDSSCMDANDDCGTLEYKYITYSTNNSEQLVRRVLDEADVLVREDIFANNVVDFQVTSSADDNVITIQVDMRRQSAVSRVITISENIDVYLRNRG